MLARLAQPDLTGSASREPLWRMCNLAGGRLRNLARGRYWRALGNTRASAALVRTKVLP